MGAYKSPRNVRGSYILLCLVQMNAEADKLAKTADEKIGHGAGGMSLFTRKCSTRYGHHMQHFHSPHCVRETF